MTSGKKSSAEFKVYTATDLTVGSYIPFGTPSGVPQLDLAIGRPGWPAGRMAEVFGFEHSGKTSLVLSAAAQIQRMGGHVVWIDCERAFSPDWAATNGADPAAIDLAETDTIEGIFSCVDKTLDAYEKIEDDRPPLLIGVDSITSVPSLESFEKNFDDKQRIGTDARAIRVGMRKINARIAASKAVVLFINHSVTNPSSPIPNSSTSAGGHALKFNAGLRIQLSRIKTVQAEQDEEKVYRGMEVGITVEKNRVGRTSTRRLSCFLLENGFDLHENLFDAFQRIDVLEKVNQRYFLFKPSGTKLARSEWKTFVDEHSKGLQEMYRWFLTRAVELGEVVNYGGEVHRSQ